MQPNDTQQIEYYASGAVYRTYCTRDGRICGTERMYREDGELMKTIVYNDYGGISAVIYPQIGDEQ